MFLFKVSCQHDQHHDVDDRHNYVDFDAAMLMVIMMLLMVVEICARFYQYVWGKVDSANIAFWVKELNQDHGTKQIPIFQRPDIKFILTYFGPF